MNWMLDLLRSDTRPSSTTSLGGESEGRRRTRRQPAVESLEGRSLLSLASIASGLLPNFNTPTTTYKGNNELLHYLNKPTNQAFPPYDISVGVASATGVGQAPFVSNSKIRIAGTAPGNSTVWIAFGPLGYYNNVAFADAKGNYSLETKVPKGTTLIRAFSGSLIRTYSQNYAFDYSNVATVRVTNANSVVTWDAIALGAIRTASLSAEEASRVLAIVHIAQYDAILAASGSSANSAFLVRPTTLKGASPDAAADSAAATVLTSLFPAQAETFANGLTDARAGLFKNAAVTSGSALGQVVGQQVLAARASDNAMLITSVGMIPNPNWGLVKPFALTSGSQFRPGPPPAAGTTAFDQALAEVTRAGRINSASRTDDQTAAALYWNDGDGSATNPGHWNTIAQQFAVDRKTNLLATARTFAMLDVAMADAAITSSDAKAAYLTPRPMSVIQTTTDSSWAPLLPTPLSPSYVSAHAAYGAAASEILSATYGRNVSFKTQPNTVDRTATRSFANFAAAAAEDAGSRVDGGVNYRFDTTAGATLGTSVGKAVLTKLPK